MKNERTRKGLGRVFSGWPVSVAGLAMLGTVLCSCPPVMAQEPQGGNVELRVKGVSLLRALQELNRRYDNRVTFKKEEVEKVRTSVTVDLTGASLYEAVSACLRGTHLQAVRRGDMVVVSPRPANRSGQSERRATVSGQVVDAQGNPLPGATVVVKGTPIGTATDMDGRYTLVVPEGDHTLQVSMVGMRTENVAVGRRTHINVSLAENVEMMDEVVVTGYQTISKERATGAYAIIDSEMLETKPTANLAEALNGMVPGLAIQSAPADGGTTRFIIRGQGTLQDNQSDRDPLIVVDGFPISGYTGTNDPFSTINPNDVESVTVLKDAAATSIYGARAANGVIVITTKKGSQTGNKLDISADAYWSISQRADLDYLFNMASAEDQFRFVEMMHSYDPINLSGTSDP